MGGLNNVITDKEEISPANSESQQDSQYGMNSFISENLTILILQYALVNNFHNKE